MSPTDRLLDSCTLVPERVKGECSWCHKPLIGRQRQWCGKSCSKEFLRNHFWKEARRWALKLANKRCSLCGAPEEIRWDRKDGRSSLEINHIVPVLGDRVNFSCRHHQENLQVLCFKCHAGVTKQQHKDGIFRKKLTSIAEADTLEA